MMRVTCGAALAALLLIAACGSDPVSSPAPLKPIPPCLDIGDPARSVDIALPIDGLVVRRGSSVDCSWNLQGMTYPVDVTIERCNGGRWCCVGNKTLAKADGTVTTIDVPITGTCDQTLIRVTATDACMATVSHTHALQITPPLRRPPQERD